MNPQERQPARRFKNPCTCGGFAHEMNGRDARRPHAHWCPQREEYNEWYDQAQGNATITSWRRNGVRFNLRISDFDPDELHRKMHGAFQLPIEQDAVMHFDHDADGVTLKGSFVLVGYYIDHTAQRANLVLEGAVPIS